MSHAQAEDLISPAALEASIRSGALHTRGRQRGGTRPPQGHEEKGVCAFDACVIQKGRTV